MNNKEYHTITFSGGDRKMFGYQCICQIYLKRKNKIFLIDANGNRYSFELPMVSDQIMENFKIGKHVNCKWLPE